MATQKVYYRIDSIQGNQVTVGIYDHIPFDGLRLAVKRKEGDEEIFDADISGILNKIEIISEDEIDEAFAE